MICDVIFTLQQLLSSTLSTFFDRLEEWHWLHVHLRSLPVLLLEDFEVLQQNQNHLVTDCMNPTGPCLFTHSCHFFSYHCRWCHVSTWERLSYAISCKCFLTLVHPSNVQLRAFIDSTRSKTTQDLFDPFSIEFEDICPWKQTYFSLLQMPLYDSRSSWVLCRELSRRGISICFHDQLVSRRSDCRCKNKIIFAISVHHLFDSLLQIMKTPLFIS